MNEFLPIMNLHAVNEIGEFCTDDRVRTLTDKQLDLLLKKLHEYKEEILSNKHSLEIAIRIKDTIESEQKRRSILKQEYRNRNADNARDGRISDYSAD